MGVALIMAGTRSGKILIVDDEPDVVSYLSTLLGEAGYSTLEARDGQEGLDIARRERPDLVSLDITMPEKSGVKFYREMREDAELGKIPIVIVTGVSNPWASPDGTGSFQRFISSRKQVPPPEGYFEKPIDPDAYLAKVAELLDRR
jgi:CheY-like chemotaxis protein